MDAVSRLIGAVATIILLLIFFPGLWDDLIKTANKNEAPTILHSSLSAPSGANILTYLSERQAAHTLSPPPKDEAGYRSQCVEQWTKRGEVDVGMVNYCVSRERDGYDQLTGILQKFGGYSWMPGVLQGAIQDWTKRGARTDSQVAYQVDREVDAFLDLQYLAQHEGIKEGTANACLDEWTKNYVQWTLVKYCYDRATGKE